MKREPIGRTTEAPDGDAAIHARDVYDSVGKRLFDGFLALVLLTVLGPPMLLIGVTVRATSRGPALYWSDRVGRDNKIFRMPKFRTMQVDTPIVATHLLSDPAQHLTPIGGFLRKWSVDELPQLTSILIGHMSFVGPRAALFNQEDLVELRTQREIHRITPGLTGWAQINGRDELPIPIKVDLDEHYLRHRSFLMDLRIIVSTGVQVVRRDGVAH